jgi:hypothetical protein
VFAKTTPDGTPLPLANDAPDQRDATARNVLRLDCQATCDCHIAVEAIVVVEWLVRCRPVPSAKDRSLLDPLGAVRPFNRVIGPSASDDWCRGNKSVTQHGDPHSHDGVRHADNSPRFQNLP